MRGSRGERGHRGEGRGKCGRRRQQGRRNGSNDNMEHNVMVVYRIIIIVEWA
jgi:hypothetical protein